MRIRILAVNVVLLALLAGCTSGINRPVSEVTAKLDQDGVQRVRVVAHSFYFEPNRIVVKAGVPVELTIKNAALFVPHNFTCPQDGEGNVIEKNLGMLRGQEVTRFTPTQKGEYPFYCDVDKHASKGMKGTLVVK
jgi:plastocyanin